MSKNSTTTVDEKDLPNLAPTYENAPETVEEAVQRLLRVEMILEDLSRAVEIASITRQMDMLDGFKQTADDYLTGKIQIVQPDGGDLNLTVVEGEIDEEVLKAAGAVKKDA
jgi:hypothetical protein